MKYRAFYFAVGLSLLLCPAFAQAQAPAPAMGSGQIKVFEVSGDVQLRSADGSKHSLIKGDVFADATTVITGSDGHTLLVLSNGSTLKIDPNAQLEIKTFKQAPFDAKAAGGTFIGLVKDPSKSITELNLINGALGGEVKALDEADGSKFTVDTPVGSNNVPGGNISFLVVRNAAGDVVSVTPKPTASASASTATVAKAPVYPIQVTASCDKTEYVATTTASMKATVVIKNNTTSMHILTFNTAQKYDFVIRDAQGKEVTRWSAEKMFAQVITPVSIKGGEALTFTTDVPLAASGKPLPAGSYTLEGIATFNSDDGDPAPYAPPANVDGRTSPRVAFKIVSAPASTPTPAK